MDAIGYPRVMRTWEDAQRTVAYRAVQTGPSALTVEQAGPDDRDAMGDLRWQSITTHEAWSAILALLWTLDDERVS